MDEPYTTPTDSPPGMSRATWAALILILVAAAVLRWMRAGADGITFDEMWHVELSTGRGSAHDNLPRNQLIPSAHSVTTLAGARPWYTVWAGMTGVVHPPLFCTTLRLWEMIFGGGDLAVKSLPLVCGVLAILLLFDAVRCASSSTTAALWAAALFAAAPMQVYLSQQVRGYSMLQLWGCGLLAAAARIDRLGINHRRALALGGCSLAMGLTHYFGLAAIAAVAIYLAFRLRGRARTTVFISLGVAGLLFLAAWGPFMWQQRRMVAETADPWLTESIGTRGQHAVATLLRSAATPIWQLLAPPDFSVLWPVALGIALFAAGLILARKRPDLWIWIFWIAGTLGFVTALDLFRSTRQLLFTRYTSLCAPGVFALAATLARPTCFLSIGSILPAALVAAALYCSTAAYPMRGGEPEWTVLGTFLSESFAAEEHAAGAPQVLIFYPGDKPQWYADILYLGVGHYAMNAFPRPIVSLSRPADEALVASLPGRSVWLISGPLDKPAELILPGCRVIKQQVLPNLAICTRLALPEKK